VIEKEVEMREGEGGMTDPQNEIRSQPKSPIMMRKCMSKLQKKKFDSSANQGRL